MTDLSTEDKMLLDAALVTQSNQSNSWPVKIGWKPRWIGTGIDSDNPRHPWQCQSLRTVIFTKLDDDAGPEKGYRWILPYTHEKGFGHPIDRNAPPVKEMFCELVPVRN